jgi:hypothetical protein
LRAGGIGHLALEDRDLLETGRLGERFDRGLGVEIRTVHHQLDFARHEQACHQQHDFPLRLPSPRDASETIDHFVKQHPVAAGLELQEFAQLGFRASGLPSSPPRAKAALGKISSACKDRADLGNGVGLCGASDSQLVVGVGDEVVASSSRAGWWGCDA